MSTEKCVRCHAYLFDGEDDIVYCPTCGAPHHRECYQALGHCALEDLHGTDLEYDKSAQTVEAEAEKASHIGDNAEGSITCGVCREKYDLSANRCPKCGAPNISKLGGSFATFDFLGGVPADCDIGDSVTAEEAKRFVAVNTRRYIPKFALLNKTHKASWNWLAFLFPCPWLLSRKMYKTGILIGLLQILISLFLFPFTQFLSSNGYTETSIFSDPQVLLTVFKEANSAQIPIFIFTGVSALLSIALMVIMGIFGDYIYKNHTLASIKKMRSESEDMDYDYQRLGGLNPILFLIGYMALSLIPSFVISLF